MTATLHDLRRRRDATYTQAHTQLMRAQAERGPNAPLTGDERRALDAAVDQLVAIRRETEVETATAFTEIADQLADLTGTEVNR